MACVPFVANALSRKGHAAPPVVATAVVRVVDAATGKPLLGAVVQTDRTKSEAATDSSGQCIVRMMASDDLTARLNGYLEQGLHLGFAPADTNRVRVEFRLPPEAAIDTTFATGVVLSPRNVTLATATYISDAADTAGSAEDTSGLGSISGVMTSARTGEPLNGVVLVEGTELGSGTDARGFFSIARVPAGTCRLHCDCMGYGSTAIHLRADPRLPTVAQFRLNEAHIDMNMKRVD